MRRYFAALALASFAFLSTRAADLPENLVAEHIPPAPEALLRAAAPYLEARSAAFWDWHPLRREVLIGTRFAETMQAHQVATPNGVRKQLTFLPEPIATASFKPKTAEYLIFLQDTGGGEFFQLYRLDPGNPHPALLTDGKSRNSMVVWSRDGDRIAYTSTRRNGRDTDVYVADPLNPGATKMVLQVNGGGWQVQDWSPDGEKILLLNYISINESYIHVLDLRTDTAHLLSASGAPKGPRISHANPKFSRDGKSIYFTTDRDSEFHRLVRVKFDELDSTISSMTTRIKWNITDYDISPDGKTIAIVSNEDGYSVLRFIDAVSGRDKSTPKIPRGVISNVKWHEKNSEVAFTFSSAQSASDVYTVSYRKGETERWTQSETGGLDPVDFRAPELVKLRSFDGLQISAFVYMPDPAKFPGKRPSLMIIHGGPESQSLPSFLGRNNFFLNELGIALIIPNVRGSAGYGKTFLTLDNGLRREDSVRDIGSIIGWIKSNKELDPERIAVMGGSYGGYMTLASMVHFSDQLRCGVDIVGISDFITFLQNTQDYRRDLRRAEYGDERVRQIREYLEKIAPAKNVHKITKPMFVIQGKNDPRVPLSEAEQMVAALRGANIETWYLMAKDEGHGFKRKRNIDFQFYATVLFLEKNLIK